MAKNPITIPDPTLNHKFPHNDTVTFSFNMDEAFTVISGGQYLTPALQSGNFPKGSFIGEYTLSTAGGELKYKYDKGDQVSATHTILIGD